MAGSGKLQGCRGRLFHFPDKTVFIKNFMIDTVYGDSATRILIETRFLVVRDNPDEPGKKKYQGMTYAWHRDQKDADLVDPGAGLDTLHMIRLRGKAVGKRWSYPSGSDCRQCHQGRGILGFITPQLNRPDSANPAVNQLKALYTAGILSKDIYKTALHRWTGLKETGTAATPEAKSRSYLAANCSHCHGNKVSLEGAEHDFDYLNPARKFRFQETPGGFVGKPTAKEAGYPQVVYAGFPESSYVMLRMKARGNLESRDIVQMPPLATYQMDSGAVAIMRDWICSLKTPARACKEPEGPGDSSYWEQGVTALHHPELAAHGSAGSARIQNGMLLAPHSARPRLFATDGRELILTPAAPGRWKIQAGLRKGVYILSDADRSAPIAVLP